MGDLTFHDETEDLSAKKRILLERLEKLGSCLIAFSGGVDSTFLLAVAHQVLGRNALACTATSIIYPSRELTEAVAFTKKEGIAHVVIPFDAMKLSCFAENNPDRCYHCKKHVFRELKNLAEQKGLKCVAHAVNMDDLRDYRPGLRAAEEMGVAAPLLDAQLSKKEIRLLSKKMGLHTWDKPPMACLASRIPFGQAITEEKLKMIGEAEELLADLGFLQYRVRCHESLARIELEVEDMQRFVDPALREKIVSRIKEIGFAFVSLDLEGYVSGSLNRMIKKQNTGAKRRKPGSRSKK